MKIIKDNTFEIEVSGVIYYADNLGIIDVPDEKIGSMVWGKGFVSANSKIAMLEREALYAVAENSAINVAMPIPVPNIAKPAEPLQQRAPSVKPSL